MLKKIILMGLSVFTFSVTGMDYIQKLKTPISKEEKIRNAIDQNDFETVVQLVNGETKPENLSLYVTLAKNRIGKRGTKSKLFYATLLTKGLISWGILYSIFNHFYSDLKLNIATNKKNILNNYLSVNKSMMHFKALIPSLFVYFLFKDEVFHKYDKEFLIYLYLQHLQTPTN